MIDSHCHLDFAVFDHDRKQLVRQCEALGIHRFLLPGTEYATWPKLFQLATEFPQFYFALGLHPYFLNHYEEVHLGYLRERLQTMPESLLAVGEIGLDFALDDDQARQIHVFEQQLALAQAFTLPVIIHQRKAHHLLIGALKRVNLQRGGVIHAFSGSYQQACDYLDLGFKLGIGGTITYQRAQKTQATLRKLPMTSFLLETDAPDMPVAGMQGQRNSPAMLPRIAEQLSSIIEQPVERVIEQTNINFQHTFLTD